MATLTIRNIPEELMVRLRQAAEGQRRSINAEALFWLEDVAERQWSRAEIEAWFDRVRANREAIYRKHGVSSDSVGIIRRMRDERTAQLAGNRRGRRAKTGTRSCA